MPAAAVLGGATAIGGVAKGKGARKAAQIQAQTAREQMALQERIYNQNAANFASDIKYGDQAAAHIQDMLGLSGNTIDATSILRNTPGYQFRVGEALRGVNSNAYARGLGDSGATLRALQETGMGLADQTFNTHIAQVGDVANRGSGAKSSLAGVSQTYANASNNIAQNAADTQSNYHMFKADNLNNTLQSLIKTGANMFGSSFGGGS